MIRAVTSSIKEKNFLASLIQKTLTSRSAIFKFAFKFLVIFIKNTSKHILKILYFNKKYPKNIIEYIQLYFLLFYKMLCAKLWKFKSLTFRNERNFVWKYIYISLYTYGLIDFHFKLQNNLKWKIIFLAMVLILPLKSTTTMFSC